MSKIWGWRGPDGSAPPVPPGRPGLRYTFHQDSPVVPPDMPLTLSCAVNRRTVSGRLLGQEEQITPYEALRAVTINAAYQYFEEKEKGSLAPGKRADLVILDRDPLSVPAEELDRLKYWKPLRTARRFTGRKGKGEECMKLMIASDLHGSAFYAKKWLQRVEEERPDRILLLGICCIMVPRNDLPEGYAAQGGDPPAQWFGSPAHLCAGKLRRRGRQVVLDFPIMADYVLLQAEEHTVFATHGHIHSPEQLPRLQPGGRAAFRPIPMYRGIRCGRGSSASIPAPCPFPRRTALTATWSGNPVNWRGKTWTV